MTTPIDHLSGLGFGFGLTVPARRRRRDGRRRGLGAVDPEEIPMFRASLAACMREANKAAERDGGFGRAECQTTANLAEGEAALGLLGFVRKGASWVRLSADGRRRAIFSYVVIQRRGRVRLPWSCEVDFMEGTV